MYLKIKQLYYKLNDNLSAKLDSLIGTITPKVPYSEIVLDDPENYTLHINYACAFIHEHQVKTAIEDVIKSFFHELVSITDIVLEPRDELKVYLSFGTMVPAKIEGKISIDKKNNVMRFNFSHLSIMHIPVESILDLLNKIPGISITLKTKDGKAMIEDNHVLIFIDKFLPNIDLEYSISDLYFTEQGLCLELKGKQISELRKKFSIDMPESYAYLIGDKIKVNKISVEDSKIIVYKEDGKPFAFNLETYTTLITDSNIKYNEKDEVLITIPADK